LSDLLLLLLLLLLLSSSKSIRTRPMKWSIE
jgi:hypothetical protein